MRLSDFRPNVALLAAPMNYMIVFLMVAIFLFAVELIASAKGDSVITKRAEINTAA